MPTTLTPMGRAECPHKKKTIDNDLKFEDHINNICKIKQVPKLVLCQE